MFCLAWLFNMSVDQFQALATDNVRNLWAFMGLPYGPG